MRGASSHPASTGCWCLNSQQEEHSFIGSPLWSNLLLEKRPGSIFWTPSARWAVPCWATAQPLSGTGKGQTSCSHHPGLATPYKLSPTALLSCRGSFPVCLPGTALPVRQSQAAAPSASCFPATCCPFWWSSWWAFLGFHPIGLSLPPRWWYVLTGGLRPMANEANCSWNYFLNIGSLVPLHLKNKPRFLISLSTVCKLRATLACQKWSCSYCTTQWFFLKFPQYTGFP